jgi:hypothetical protein
MALLPIAHAEGTHDAGAGTTTETAPDVNGGAVCRAGLLLMFHSSTRPPPIERAVIPIKRLCGGQPAFWF